MSGGTQLFGDLYAGQYDTLYEGKNYQAECDLLEQVFKQYGDGEIRKVLDLGCGTGNHSLPLARRGYAVTGVDASPAMLACARRKVQAEFFDVARSQGSSAPRPVFYEQDIRALQLDQTFDAALLMFAVLGYQQTNADVLATLRGVQRALRPGGLLVFDVWYGPAVLAIRPEERVKVIKTPDGQVIRSASGSLDVNRHLCTVCYHVWHLVGDHLAGEIEEVHEMRYFFPLELDMLLESCGMRMGKLANFNDLAKPPDETCWNVLVVAQKQI